MSAHLAKRFAWPLLALAAMTGGSFLATTVYQYTHNSPAYGAEPTRAPQPELVAPANDMSTAFRAVHRAVKDAVVNINISKKLPAAIHARIPRNQIPEEFRHFFGPDAPVLPDIPDNHGGGGGMSYGTGSGVIVSPDGYILTNNHVVDDADEITVRMDDGREFKAKTIGRDPKTDLAVIKIEADKLTYARLGDSDAAEVGDIVLAFGSPFGFEQTMTEGIISAKGRSNVNIIGSHNPALAGLTYENFLQTDAAINPGNSGGPLVNLKGEVLGIDTAIASRTGSYNGIGFAIPSNDAKYVMDSLIKSGKVVRGYLGVGIMDVHAPRVHEQVVKEGYTATTGVLVEEVKADSPGGKGGLQPGDIITDINAKPVDTITHLRTLIARTRPGEKINLRIWRDGKTADLSIPVGEQPDSAVVTTTEGAPDKVVETEAAGLGLSVKPLDAAAAKKQNLKAGVVVSDVDDQGLAAQVGLTPGDIITSINRTPVATPEEFTAALKKADVAKGIRLTVRGVNGSERLVYVEKH